MRWALAVAILALVSLAAGASAAEVDLRVGEQLRLGETTLALGHLDPGSVELTDVHAVGVETLDVPDGTLYVCSSEGGQRDEVPPIPALQDRCRDEDAYENPKLTVSDRTWLVFAGNLTLADPPNASMTAIVSDPEGRLRLASVTHGTVGAEVDDQAAFRPQRAASQIQVQADGETQTYNGTDWVFYLEASGRAELAARGLHAELPMPANLTLRPAGTAAMREALDARTLLDLQSAALDPDEREPVANATRLAGSATRLPPLVDGALLGHLNGTIGERSFDPDETALVGLERMDGEIAGAELTGTLEPRFVRTDAGVAPGLGEPAGVPWLAAVLLWVAAGVTIAVGPAAVVPGLRTRALGIGLFAVALVAWDAIFANALGTSALAASAGAAGLGVVFALAAFEAIAFGLAWLLLALPVRLVGERWLVDRVAPYVGGVATLALLAYAWLQPGAIVSIGRLVAEL